MKEWTAVLWAWIRKHRRFSIGLALALVVASIGTGLVISQLPPPRGQDCGAFTYPLIVRDPAVRAASVQVLSCFWHAYRHCQPATMVRDAYGTDTGSEGTTTVERTGAGCDVYYDTWYSGVGGSSHQVFRCASMTQQGEKLYLAQCDHNQQPFTISPITLNFGNCGEALNEPSAQVEQCFADAYALCAPAELTYISFDTDKSHFLRFTLQDNCTISYGFDPGSLHPYQATCDSLTLRADGLHFFRCGRDGDILVPPIEPRPSPTPTPTPNYPGFA